MLRASWGCLLCITDSVNSGARLYLQRRSELSSGRLNAEVSVYRVSFELACPAAEINLQQYQITCFCQSLTHTRSADGNAAVPVCT